MTVLIVGNDERMLSVFHRLMLEFPDFNFYAVLDKNQCYVSEKDLLKELHQIPTIFAGISRLNSAEKKIYLDNGGETEFDYLICLPIHRPSVAILHQTRNVFYGACINQNERLKSYSSQSNILLIGRSEHTKEDLFSLFPNSKIFQKNPEDILCFHYYEDQITSVTFADQTLIGTDWIVVNSFRYVCPEFLQDITLEQGYLNDQGIVYLGDCSSTFLDNTIDQMKPEKKYFCIRSNERISACEIIENDNRNHACFIYDICRMHQNNAVHIDEAKKELCSRMAKPTDGSVLIHQEIAEIRWVASFIDRLLHATSWRYHASGKIFALQKAPDELFLINSPGYFPDRESLKSALGWIIEQNYLLLHDMNLLISSGTRKFKAGIACALKEEKYILYFGAQTLFHEKIHDLYQKSGIDTPLLCMGCAGIDYSMKYGNPYVSGLLEQGILVDASSCAGLILDKPCLTDLSRSIIEEKNLPFIDSLKTNPTQCTKEWIQFFQACKEKETKKTLEHPRISIQSVAVNPCHELDAEKHEKWLFLPSCCGSFWDKNLMEAIHKYKKDGFALYALGCSLSLLLKTKLYHDYLPEIFGQENFGAGTFGHTLAVAEKLKNKTKTIFLHGLLKDDAWIDTLILVQYFQFELDACDESILKRMDVLRKYLTLQ